jgi:hypothetical protein
MDYSKELLGHGFNFTRPFFPFFGTDLAHEKKGILAYINWRN